MATAVKKAGLRRALHRALRSGISFLPQSVRFGIFRRMVDCDPDPDERLVLKVAETREELEACFSILHDAYVASGFMQHHESGLRVTPYHALPTTTTLCAKFDGRVVGTITIIRDGVFGFPLQTVFDLSSVRAKSGNIAEISALAVHPDFRKTGGVILFPLMKFMYEYCKKYFDTRHLVIAVNPDRIELYESLLFFRRLPKSEVDSYDFANGAPAVGATLDLAEAEAKFKTVYGKRTLRRNLYDYFVRRRLENIEFPRRKYHVTTDPVLSPDDLDHFFNHRVQVFEGLDDRRRALLWSIYDQPEYRSVLPMLEGEGRDYYPLRRHQRFSICCPASFGAEGKPDTQPAPLKVLEISQSGFQASSFTDLPVGETGVVQVELGVGVEATVEASVVRVHEEDDIRYYGFRLSTTDPTWTRAVADLETGRTARDLDH